ncbi:MAM and LDL-receptor class A domain-containing protein 1-like [Argopecten irradians]|uniref:MAM and LDL-receptor class A domain-containing protein 1-like n=1 Tax=Argopecten irradians TaxID=31199 RepID=UPI003721D47C
MTTPSPCTTDDIENAEALLWQNSLISGSSAHTVSECIRNECRPPTYGIITEAAVTSRLSEEHDSGVDCASYEKGTIAAVVESPGKTFHRCICPGFTCGLGQTKCATSGECIVNERVCDGQRDCSDGSDEGSCDEMLILTEQQSGGIVMIWYRTLTTLVCDHGTKFTDREARVICKAMGFRGGTRSSSGRKVLDTKAWLSLTCSETATSMSECEQEWIVFRHACASMIPAAVNCY